MNPYYPVLSLDEARAYEESVLGGDSGKTSRAMENAGRAIGAAIHDDYREIRPWPGNPEIHVLGGKGLNTGDALVACETLQAFLPGLQVTLVCTASTTEMNPLAGAVLERIRVSMGERFRIVSAGDYIQAGTRKVDVLLDGLYGHGFKPPLRPEAAQLLKQVNSRTDIALRVSVDLPSGMGADTDPDSFVADITCIPGVAKEPCFREANWPFTGRLRFLEIEPFLDQPVDENRNRLLASPRIHKSLNRLRPPRSDKRQYGHCLIIAGSSQMPGAALMATRAALQAGAGLVTTFAPSFVCRQIASSVPEAMWRPIRLTPEGGFDAEAVRMVTQLAPAAQALLIGPGLLLDRSTEFNLCRIIRETRIPLIIDASALMQDIVGAVIGRPVGAGPVIITPHHGEFARLQGIAEQAQDREALMKFCSRYHLMTVLKGSPNLIADGNRVVALPVGGPVLARGGTGDILSGMMTALLAQNPEDPFSAALKAVSWHGAAADSLARESGDRAVTSTEILPHLSRTLRA